MRIEQFEVKGQALPLLDKITLTVKPGEFVSIVGSSGCGKSTLLRVIVGQAARHARNAFDAQERRVLKRISLSGSRPF